MPTPEALFAAIIFGAIGMAAFVYGKKSANMKPMILGIALMGYPYFISQTWLLYLVGVLLTGSLFVWRE
jgi:hypothetical protein